MARDQSVYVKLEGSDEFVELGMPSEIGEFVEINNPVELTFEPQSDFLRKLLGFPSKREIYKRHLPKKVIVSGPCVICIWQDGTKTISRCHDGDEMDVRTGVMLCAIKKWMPGGSYWLDVMDDVDVEYQGRLKKVLKKWKKKAAAEVAHGDASPVIDIKPKPTDPYHRGLAYSDEEKLAALEMMEGGADGCGGEPTDRHFPGDALQLEARVQGPGEGQLP